MATAIRPIGHDDRLSLVEHLDELRTRLIVCVIAFAVAFGVTLWQRGPLLDVLNKPLDQSTQKIIDKGHGPLAEAARNQTELRNSLIDTYGVLRVMSHADGLSAADQAVIQSKLAHLKASIAKIPKDPPERQPVTLGVGEPFTTTITVSALFALMLSLPVILYQLYAFILPAFSPKERKVAMPLMGMIPFLFAAGVVFGYFVVLPPAIEFLQNFNAGSFEVLVQAKQYYKFAAMTLLGVGLLFQMPVGILAATRIGLVTPQQLRKNRRYAIVIIAVVAMLLPGTAPIPMLILMIPLLVLFEASILFSAWVERSQSKLAEAEAAVDDALHEGD